MIQHLAIRGGVIALSLTLLACSPGSSSPGTTQPSDAQPASAPEPAQPSPAPAADATPGNSTTPESPSQPAENYGHAVDQINSTLNCIKPKGVSGLGTAGDLFVCKVGEEVTLYVNQNLDNNTVKSIKLIWNDYTRDVGYGVHAGTAAAKNAATKLGRMYGLAEPEQLAILMSSEDGAELKSETHAFAYTYRQGPSIDERMILITQQ